MNLMQLPDERNSKRQISEEKEQKKNGHKKYNLFLPFSSSRILKMRKETSQKREIDREKEEDKKFIIKNYMIKLT